MNPAFQDSNVLKNIVNEIIRECKGADVYVEEKLVYYLAHLFALDQDFGFQRDGKFDRVSIERFIKGCVTRLCNQNSAPMITLKMQLLMLKTFMSIPDSLQKHHESLEDRIMPLTKEIVNTKMDLDQEELEKVYKKIIVHVVLMSGMGYPTQTDVLREATAALRSVFPLSDLPMFCEQPRRERVKILRELQGLVAGVRLFNRDCGKSSTGIVELPEILDSSLESTRHDVKNALLETMEHVNAMTTVLDYALPTNTEEEEEVISIEQTYRPEVTPDELEDTKEKLVLYRQYEIFIRRLLLRLDNIECSMNESMNQLKIEMRALHDLVQYRSAIPSDQVCPLFLNISKIWFDLQDDLYMLSDAQMLMNNLKNMVVTVSSEYCLDMTALLKNRLIPSDAERLELSMDKKITQKGNQTTVIDISTVKNIEKIPLQYLGFCCWALVHGHGILIPANPNMGLCKWRNEYYAFSSVEAAAEFGKDPDKYKYSVLEIVRGKPELIHLLQLQEYVMNMSDHAMKVCDMLHFPTQFVETTDTEMQTELHPIPTNIDKDYMWNVWDYRRQALKMAYVLNSKTDSTQTSKTSKKFSIAVQTYDQKAAETQTMRENYTNVPTPQTFLFGLRGRKDDKQFKIDLTRPVTEDYYSNTVCNDIHLEKVAAEKSNKTSDSKESCFPKQLT